jgi:acetophenone carboxylase
MSYPTLEEKLAALKVTPASDYERRCADALAPGSYEIGVQRTADILDVGY